MGKIKLKILQEKSREKFHRKNQGKNFIRKIKLNILQEKQEENLDRKNRKKIYKGKKGKKFIQQNRKKNLYRKNRKHIRIAPGSLDKKIGEINFKTWFTSQKSHQNCPRTFR